MVGVIFIYRYESTRYTVSTSVLSGYVNKYYIINKREANNLTH